ncbi:hypothetical protein [Altibacter lentus]|uniref:hypothetical protein n=1 Tax=Altibacter lentus TaxID=1223410 RepID=UPI000557F9E5|nr:hypothetical protein [Altibacter lentus]
MKNTITALGITFLFLLFSNNAQAQFNVNTNPFWEGEIVMLDGRIKTGYIQVPAIAAEKKISYKETKGSSAESVDRKEIARIKVISENGNHFYFDNLPIGSVTKDKVSKKRYLLLTHASNNFVSFYVMSQYKVNKRSGTIDFVSSYVQGKDIPTFSYYMSKGDKTDAKLYYMTKQLGGIKKDAELHFKEDPELVKLIENKELKGDDISEIIKRFLETTQAM